LDFLDKTVDTEGMIVESENPTQRVLTAEGQEISFESFGGVRKGSEIFISNNLVSLMKLSKEE